MTLITIKSTPYGFKVETAGKSIPTERQLKLADKFIKDKGLTVKN